MGGIAIALAQAGHRITGSDEGIYEPMNSALRRAGIQVASRYAGDNIPADADAVIVGRRLRDDNPELEAVVQRGLRRLSFPAFLQQEYLGASSNLVVAGGVGKTTTTAMLAWALECEGTQPDYLIGGIARNFASPARLLGSALTVLEGDEYASCFDDRTPKFLYYAPDVVIVTNLLADHPDLYPDVASLYNAFEALVRLLPARGCLVLPYGDEATQRLAAAAACAVVTVGEDVRADAPITALDLAPGMSRFRLGGVPFALPSCGRMNVRNAAMAAVAARHAGVPFERTAAALACFAGVVDRQDAKDIEGCTMVTDKATHPTSIRDLHEALRQHYPGRRLLVAIQPRATGGRQWLYQRELPAALSGFDQVLLTGAYEHAPAAGTAWQDDPFSIDALADDLRRLQGHVTIVRAVTDVPDALADRVEDGDVVLLLLREQFVSQVPAVEAALLNRQATA